MFRSHGDALIVDWLLKGYVVELILGNWFRMMKSYQTLTDLLTEREY